MGFPLFVLPKRRPRQLSTMPRGARGSVVPLGDRPVGVPSYRTAPPLRRAPPRPDSPVVRPGFGFDKIVFPGHALHEKGLQRQKGVGPLVNSQERRAAVVPVINRG